MCPQHMAAMLLEPARGDHRAARRCLRLPDLAGSDRPPHVQHGLDHRREDDTGALDQLAQQRFIWTAADGADKQ
jgi:hypothetical protein